MRHFRNALTPNCPIAVVGCVRFEGPVACGERSSTAEHRPVAPVVGGSIPLAHPKFRFLMTLVRGAGLAHAGQATSPLSQYLN